MLRLRHFSAIATLAACTAVAGCGSVPDSTSCALDPSCNGTDASSHNDGGGGDTGSPDTRECTPGDKKMVDCNQCVCNGSGTFDCEHHECPDTGPPPSTCPDTANPGGACTGDTHCIYHTPCDFGCDCVVGKWLCGVCPG